MGETQTPHFHDFWIFEPVITFQNQFILSLEVPGHLTNINNIWGRFRKYYLYKSRNRGNRKFRIVGPDLEKTGTGK